MVWHQHVGVDRTTVACRRAGEAGQIQLAVAVGEKAQGAVISALDDVQRYVGKLEPRSSRHRISSSSR
jgi:hypothetical protein